MILLLDLTDKDETIKVCVRRDGQKEHTHEYPRTISGSAEALEALDCLLEAEVKEA